MRSPQIWQPTAEPQAPLVKKPREPSFRVEYIRGHQKCVAYVKKEGIEIPVGNYETLRGAKRAGEKAVKIWLRINTKPKEQQDERTTQAMGKDLGTKRVRKY